MTDPFSLHYSNDNKNNTFNNSGNNRHGLKTLRVNRPYLTEVAGINYLKLQSHNVIVAYCPAGSYLVNEGTCNLCPENYYKTDHTGSLFSTECTPCPSSRPGNLMLGSTSLDDCKYRTFLND